MAEDEDCDHIDSQQWHRIAEDCFSKRRLHNRNELNFVEDMVAMTLRGYLPSPAQQRWLMKIHHRREVDGNENSDI
jgi:hypothetical protein